MCGIAGIFIKDPSVVRSQKGLENFVNMLHLGIEHRGKMATGIVAVAEDGHTMFDKDAVPASEFIQSRDPLPKDTKIVLLHTRATTKGSEKDHRNNHPVIRGSCFTIHNGHISNDDALFEHYKLDRNAEVDTEIIAALMEKSDFHVDTMIDYLSKLDGSMASATVDPKRHPNTVVLAKTYTSPIIMVEQPKFIVWASELDPIREAWGHILGTPPSKKRFFEVPSRELMVITDNGIERFNIPFDHGKPTNKPTTHRSGLQRHEWNTVGGQEFDPTKTTKTHTQTHYPVSPSARPKGPREDGFQSNAWKIGNFEVKQEVEALRKLGQGKCVTLDMANKLMNADRFTITWRACVCCDTMVRFVEDIKVCSRGEWCTDCYEAWMRLIKEQTDDEPDIEAYGCSYPYLPITQNLDEIDFEEVSKYFTREQRDAMDLWALDESFVHNETLKILGVYLGMESETVDFLLFRMTEKQMEKIGDKEEVQGWVNATMNLYDFEYGQQWQNADEDEGAFVDIFKPKEPEVRYGLMRTPIPMGPASTPVVKRLFEKVNKAHGENCLFCRRKHKVETRRTETKELIPYCTQHYGKCATRGCKQDTNHTRHDGIRVCHEHSKGVKECYADTMLRKEGYSVGVRV